MGRFSEQPYGILRRNNFICRIEILPECQLSSERHYNKHQQTPNATPMPLQLPQMQVIQNLNLQLDWQTALHNTVGHHQRSNPLSTSINRAGERNTSPTSPAKRCLDFSPGIFQLFTPHHQRRMRLPTFLPLNCALRFQCLHPARSRVQSVP